MPKPLARRSPMINVSYLSSLLVVWKIRTITYRRGSPYGGIKTRISRALFRWGSASVNFQKWWCVLSHGLCRCFHYVSNIVTTYSIYYQVRYSMSLYCNFFLCNWILNSLNLIAHLTILPDVLDFCKICLSDVSTIIVWAWNNSRNFVSHQSGCRCASPFLYISFQQHLVICLCSTLATGNFFHLYDQQCSDRHADDADVSKNNSPGKGLANAIKLVKCCLIT